MNNTKRAKNADNPRLLATAKDLSTVYMMHNILENEGIESFVLQEDASSAFTYDVNVYPKIMIREEDYLNAKSALVKEGYEEYLEEPLHGVGAKVKHKRWVKSVIYASFILFIALILLFILNIFLNHICDTSI